MDITTFILAFFLNHKSMSTIPRY